MKKVEFLQHNRLVTYRVCKSFWGDKFRILIDRENQDTTAVIGNDGENEREFETQAQAEMFILCYVNSLLESGVINSFTAF